MKQSKLVLLLLLAMFASIGVIYLTNFTKTAVNGTPPPDTDYMKSEKKSILMLYAGKKWPSDYDRGYDAGKLLSDVVNNSVDLGEIERLKALSSNEIYADAPDVRSGYERWIQICIAESIAKNDEGNALSYCGITDTWPRDIDWEYPETEKGIDSADDLTAADQVLPFLITGLYYYEKKDSERADYYFRQIINHDKQIRKQYTDIKSYDNYYSKMFNFASELTNK